MKRRILALNSRILAAATVVISAVLLEKPPAFCGTADFQPTVANKNSPPGKAPEGMVWISGGEFSMGAAVGGEPDFTAHRDVAATNAIK